MEKNGILLAKYWLIISALTFYMLNNFCHVDILTNFGHVWPIFINLFRFLSIISANLQKRMWDLSTYSHLMVLETKIVKHFPDKEEVDSLDVTCYKHLTSLCSLINRVQKCVLNLWKPLGLAAFVAVVFYFHKVTNKEEEMKVALGVGRR